ncbi:MAG: exonuclease SbcCD subunit D [Verrucomicrobiales bacterium]
MRFLHTADWHLGRIFHQTHLTEDQDYVLQHLVELAVENKVDVVLISGDLYDRAVPAPEAVEVLDRVWQQLVLEHDIAVVAISGNHDSGARLGFGAALMRKAGLHVVTQLADFPQAIVIDGVEIYALPYHEPNEVRAWLGDLTVTDHASAIQACLAQVPSRTKAGRPRLLLCHGFVEGMAESDSERPLTVGGAASVPLGVFEGFDYVALGHLHAPQEVAAWCRYSGSPMKYSFSEVPHTKGVWVGEMSSSRVVEVEFLPLRSRKDVREVRGTLKEIVAAAKSDPTPEDYLRVILSDEGALFDAPGQLKQVYPNVLHIEREFLDGRLLQPEQIQARRNLTEEQLFGDFWKALFDEACSEEDLREFRSALATAREAES